MGSAPYRRERRRPAPLTTVTEYHAILIGGGLLAAGVVCSMLATRVRLPALVALIAAGMLLGTDGVGGLELDDYDLARTVGVIALAVILFEGGLATGWRPIRSVIAPALGLAIVGTMVTAAIVGLAAHALFGLSLLEGLLLGSILSATDGAAVFALLQGTSLRERVALTLEGEAGFNDPVAIFLVIGFVEWLGTPGYGALDMLGLFLQEMGIGAVVGLLVGILAARTVGRSAFTTAGLYPVASLAALMLAYGLAATLHGSGFLAVYLTGLAVGSVGSPERAHLLSFHQGLAWVAQVVMFVMLGLLVFPSQLPGAAVEGAVLAVVLMLVARPLATVVGTAGAGLEPGERALIGWAGLRGAVPVVLATFPVIDAIPDSLEFFNIVFFAVLLSTILQGTTVEALARRLGVVDDRAAGAHP